MSKKELDKSDIESLGFDVEEVMPRVFKVRNFITTQELEDLYTEATSYDEDSWSKFYFDEMRAHCLVKFGRDDLEALEQEGLLSISKEFVDRVIQIKDSDLSSTLNQRTAQLFAAGGLDDSLEVSGFRIFQRLYENAQLKSHYDQYSDKLVEYAAVLYINDDYIAGELFFPRLNFSLKPEPATLMLFPGTELFEHGVTPVGAGPVRYVLPAFIKSKHPDGSMAGWADFN